MENRLPATVLWRSLSLTERTTWIREIGDSTVMTRGAADNVGRDRLRTIIGSEAYRHWKCWARLHGVRTIEQDLATIQVPPSRPKRILASEWESFAVSVLHRPAVVGDDRPTARRSLEAVLHPFVDEAMSRIRSDVADFQRLAGNLVTPGFFLDLEQVLYRWMFTSASGSLILEVNVARLRGTLRGTSAEERFRDFIDRMMSSPARLRRFYRAYPVLLRTLSTIALHHIAFVRTLLECYVADRVEIARLMDCSDPGRISRFQFAGDSHDSGRRVTIVRFESGAAVVFKPRAPERDEAFQRLIDWINNRGFRPALQRLRIVSRPKYGWYAFLVQKPAHDREAVRRYYTRVGGLIALLRSLRGSDMHFENVIASGENPYVVDLEVLLNNRAPHLGSARSGNSPAERVVRDSVLTVGFLPGKSRSADSPDFSALGKNEGTSLRGTVIANPLSDELRIEHGHHHLGRSRNLPELDGHEVTVEGFQDDLVNGFEQVYSLLAANKRELADSAGPLAEVLQSESRVVLASTHSYGLIQRNSWHPDHLQDGVVHEAFLVSSLYALARGRRRRSHVVTAEYRALVAGDIPKFSSRPLSKDIWAAECRPFRYFDVDAWTICRQQIESLGEEDLRLQRELIAFSLAMLNQDARDVSIGHGSLSDNDAPGTNTGVAVPIKEASATNDESDSNVLSQKERAPRATGTRQLDTDRFLEEALRIGERICDDAVVDDDIAEWITPVAMGSGQSPQVGIDAGGTDLYHGAAGVALFLVQLAAICPSKKVESVAAAAIEFCRRRLALVERNTDRMAATAGAFSGTASVAYGLLRCSEVLGRPELANECLLSVIEDIRLSVKRLADLPEKAPVTLDIIGGPAGLIQVALACGSATDSKEALPFASELGFQILARQEDRSVGCAWPSPIPSSDLFTGLAHGAAGIAWSLRLLGAATGETRFTDCARRAILYERSRFLRDECAWPDVRLAPGAATTEMSWCWGAPGVAISRLAVPEGYLDAADIDEITFIVNKLLEAPISWSDCVCHGEFGNLELPLLASDRLNREEWRTAALARANLALERRRKNGDWRDGLSTKFHKPAPGLMVGLAGIGFQLLRLAVPRVVPSMLALGGSRLDLGVAQLRAVNAWQ